MQEAELAIQEALAIEVRLLPADAFSLAALRSQLAGRQEEAGRFAQAQETWAAAVGGLGKHNDSITGVNIRLKFAKLLLLRGRLDQAEAECREALRLAKAKLESSKAEPAFDKAICRTALLALAKVLESKNELPSAVEKCREALALNDRVGFAAIAAFRTRAMLGRLLAEASLAEVKSNSPDAGVRTQSLERAHEAEQLLRDSLTFFSGDNQIRGDLGLALVAVAASDSSFKTELRAAKLQEAEQLIRASYDDVKQEQQKKQQYKENILVALKDQRIAVERLVVLYEIWQKPNETTKWEQELKTIVEQSAAQSNERSINPPGHEPNSR